MFTEPGSAREEAERLVAAGLAFASLAANAHPEIATGSAACCVCPFCKLIEAVRDPDPQTVERLATGAGDLAVGVAGLLRSLSGLARPAPDPWSAATDRTDASPDSPAPAHSPGAGFETAGGARFSAAGSGDAASAAGAGFETAGTAGFDSSADPAPTPQPRKAVAKKAVKPAVPRFVPDSETATERANSAEGRAADTNEQVTRPVAKKAIKKARPKPTPGASG